MKTDEAIKSIVELFESDPFTKTEINKTDIDTFAANCHSIFTGIGMFIRNNYDLWVDKSELHIDLKSKGIWHPDDMSNYLIREAYNIIKLKQIQNGEF